MVHWFIFRRIAAVFSIATLVLGQESADLVYSGNYELHQCGTQAANLQRILDQTWSMLQGVIKDVAAGGESKLGYPAIFGDPAQIPYVSRVFQNIAAGNKTAMETRQGRKDRTPAFLCVNAGIPGPAMQTLINRCKDFLSPIVPIDGTKFLTLCPVFFFLDPAPEPSDCPTWGEQGNIMTSYGLMANQYSMLVHSLARLYLGQDQIQPEVTSPSRMLQIPADSARRNARNYELYASSVQANCTQWPGVPTHRRPGRK